MEVECEYDNVDVMDKVRTMYDRARILKDDANKGRMFMLDVILYLIHCFEAKNSPPIAVSISSRSRCQHMLFWG